jgi:hypothetical protein
MRGQSTLLVDISGEKLYGTQEGLESIRRNALIDKSFRGESPFSGSIFQTALRPNWKLETRNCKLEAATAPENGVAALLDLNYAFEADKTRQSGVPSGFYRRVAGKGVKGPWQGAPGEINALNAFCTLVHRR